jgi:hypothetical protein
VVLMVMVAELGKEMMVVAMMVTRMLVLMDG